MAEKTPEELTVDWPEWKHGLLDASAKATNIAPRPIAGSQPVRLSADMLGEEDLRQVMVYLEELRPFYEAAYRLYAKHTGGQIYNERLDGLIATMVKIDRLLGKGE